MPPPRLQSVFLVLSMLSLLLLLCYLSFTTFASDSHGQATSSFLFPTSAVISLTDDNSTFFISRPAAFGPLLPKSGLDGELFVLEEGQLACDDAPGWDPSTALDAAGAPLAPEGAVGDDDGTDNNLNPRLPSAAGKPLSGHADIQSLQQSAEIGGKIVLVQRGGCGFLEKVLWTQRRGGIALIVGDYKRPGIGGGGGGGVLVTMYAKGDTSNVSIPSVFTSHTTAALLTTLLPQFPRQQAVAGPSPPKSLAPKPSSPPRVGHATPPSRPLMPAGDRPQLSGARIPERPAGPLHPIAPTTTPITTTIPAVKPIATAAAADMPAGARSRAKKPLPPAAQRSGLWITLTPTTMTSSPFFDTLLVLVVSPLVTLTVVYTLLLIRTRIRRRRWRAPKSLVERLPVRTYQATVTPPMSSAFPSRTSSLRAARSGGDESANTTLPRGSLATQVPKRRANDVPSQNVGRAFHRRWSGCSECVVCLEEYIDGVSRVMKLPCGHEFHVGCITPWLTTRRRTCPICKGDVVRGIRAISDPETAGDGADETTPLVMGVDVEEIEDGDIEAGGRTQDVERRG